MASYLIRFGLNFGWIFLAMALFFAPFVTTFWYQNQQQIREKRPHFNYFMERFFLSRPANWLVFTWAAAEAVLWFIIPEFLLVLLIFMKIQRKFDLVKYDFGGTIVGTIIGLQWRMSDSSIAHLPYIRPRMVAQVHTWYNQQGIAGLLHQPFSGIPYKVFTHVGAGYHFFWLWFVLVAVLTRMIRYVIIYQATVAIYPLLHRYVRRHYLVLFIVAIAIFTIMLLQVVHIYS